VDPEHRRLSLGLKQLRPNIWEEFFSQHQVGEVITGTIVRFANFGVFVELAEGIEGLCHISEFDEETAAWAQKGEGVGQSKSFRILRILPKEKRIGLSLHNLETAPTQDEVSTPGPSEMPASEPAGTILTDSSEPLPAGEPASNPTPGSSETSTGTTI